jgi:hypothetical protein
MSIVAIQTAMVIRALDGNLDLRIFATSAFSRFEHLNGVKVIALTMLIMPACDVQL